MRFLITGASGSGTSTLGRALAKKLNAPFFDADDFYWLPTDPPYSQKRPFNERLSLMLAALNCTAKSVVAGSIMNWGEELESSFSHIVFLQVTTEVRLQRIRLRELARFGKINPAFLEWAGQYDEGPPEGRSLTKHHQWLETRNCQVIRLVGEQSTHWQLQEIYKQAIGLNN